MGKSSNRALATVGSSMSLESFLRRIVRAEMGEVMREYLEPRLREVAATVEELSRSAAANDADAVFVSVEKAARMVDVRPATIREWIKRGHLTRYQSGRLIRVKVAELHEYLSREAENPAVAAIDVDAQADRLFDELLEMDH